MTTKMTSAYKMALALNEAVAIFGAEGVVVTPEELKRALMQSCGLDSPQSLLEHSWTPDMIVHSVDWDSLRQGQST